VIHGRCREDDLVAIMAYRIQCFFLLLSSAHLAIERALGCLKLNQSTTLIHDP
jgi:hypothetical protein